MFIKLSFKQLSQWQRSAFCCALIERMLPNYKMFTQIANFGDLALLRNQLDLLWQKLSDRKIKINAEAQLTKLELQTPSPEDFDFFGAYSALDTCMALMSVLQGAQETDIDYVEQVSQLSQNSVSHYIELTLAQEYTEADQITLLVDVIKQHPLMQFEGETQQELFDFLLSAAETKKTCQQLKTLALVAGVSNLGIEIE